ncbi:MAG: RluA family pseudouridine synthase [Lachnospiraceae bacterium]|nr:RluA family pseudouridine synthase [Lachnospiraceae bacterium]
MEILFEDEYLIVCIKPVGILSQKDASGSKNMVDELNLYLHDKNEAGNVYVVHRLDKNVSGVMVFAKSSKVAAELSKIIGENKFNKEYMAVIKGTPNDKEGVLEDLLFKDSSKNKTYVVKRERKGVKKASLEYKVVDTMNVECDIISKVWIKLHTGRTHQIRVQFASRKMPLLGDGKYGSRENKCDVALWSYRISFIHPVTREKVDCYKNPPDKYPWW